MVLENLWVDSGEVSETPADLHSHPAAAPESMSLFGTPPYPQLGDDASTNTHDRVTIKSKKELSPMNSEIRYDEDDDKNNVWSGSFGPFSVDYMKCGSSPGPCEPIQSTSMPLAPPPPSPTFPEDENGSLCLSIGLDTLLTSNGDPLEDVKDSSAIPGVCGLRNLGNTCFMSAGLQCLSNTPTLLQFFVARSPLDKLAPETLTAQFSTLLQRMWSGENRVVHPVEFKHSLGVHFPQFQDYRQHDCQEFLALLLDSLHEQLNTAGQASPQNPDQAQSLDRFSNSSLSHSSESSVDAQNTFRIQPIPENVAPFRLAELSNGVSTNNQAMNLTCKKEKNELAMHVNCTSNGSHLHDLQDILKDAKTSNVNVLVEEQEANNTIRFDSDKFPRHDPAKVREIANPNLLETYDFDSKTVCVKRIKDTNLTQEQRDSENAESGGLDLKRIKLTELNNCQKEHLNSLLDDAAFADEAVLGTLKHTNSDAHSPCSKEFDQNSAECSLPESSLPSQLAEDDCVAMESFPESSQTPSHHHSRSTVSLHEDDRADHHWGKHLASNKSCIADTFLGQYKSTVVCSECNHVSVTYEPFMYLSVPLPHAMERQLRITYVPLEAGPVVRILLTMNKQDKVRHLREAIIDLRLKEGFPLDEGVAVVLAEVFDHHIAKFLDDVAPLRYVNDTNRSIYALEVIPPPPWFKRSKPPSEFMELIDVPSIDDVDLPVLGCEPPPLSIDSESVPSSSWFNQCKQPSDCTESMNGPAMNNVDFAVPASEQPPFSVNSDTEPSSSWFENHKQTRKYMGLIDMPSADDVECPVLGCEPPPASDSELGKVQENSDDKLTADSAGVSDHEVTSSEDEDVADVIEDITDVRHSPIRVDNICESYNGCDRGDDWKSCAICLDEMNKDMRRHIGCDCVLCEGCIENACKHNGSSDTMPCPMCNQIVKPNSEFVRVDKFISSKPTVRLLNVPVVFRLDSEGDGNNNQKSMKLFGHPNVLKLPSVLPASELELIVKRLVHTDVKYSILIVDGVGYHCSRCLYPKHCRGCPVPVEGDVLLRPVDTLAVRFTETVKEFQPVNHPSMQNLRSHEPLSLYDCLKAFSESELLDEHNPWFCPVCEKNQCATKTLSVWRYPDFLIVYLKRFVFHNGMSIKLDNKVTYPLNGLLVNVPSSPHQGSHVYNLYACVCHYGGISAGHYTGYAKHPVSSDWHYFNDESVSHQKPQEEDYSNAYILFYHKQGAAFPELNLEEPMKPNIDHLIERLDSTMDQDGNQDLC